MFLSTLSNAQAQLSTTRRMSSLFAPPLVCPSPQVIKYVLSYYELIKCLSFANLPTVGGVFYKVLVEKAESSQGIVTIR